jgi:glycine/D-amino acid oxidase-like deaminating enzyme
VRIVVAGAGAWGGWIALHLRRAGHDVKLVDPWGPGNARASSGDESRIVRANYGAASHYVGMGVRALELWREFETKHRVELIRRCGLLWMEGSRDSANRASLPLMRDAHIKFEELSPRDLKTRYPQIDPRGIEYGILEPDAGYAFARRACRAVVEVFVSEGGRFIRGAVNPTGGNNGPLCAVSLDDGRMLEADAFVFACGPWLPQVLPDVIGDRIQPTRQEIFYFGDPGGANAFTDDTMPAWIDHSQNLWYGNPGNEFRGFKIGDDTRGATVDPTTQCRIPTADMINKTRDYAAYRFPALATMPITESRVCQYENTPDNDFILDRHPRLDNVWIAGGGSGHGFKHGPAIGEHVAGLVCGTASARSEFSLARDALQIRA